MGLVEDCDSSSTAVARFTLVPSELTGAAPLASPRVQAGEPPPVGRMPSNLRPTTGKEPAAVPIAAPPRREIRVQRPASLSPSGGTRATRDPLLGPTPDVMPQEPPTVYQSRLRPDAGAPPTVVEMMENRPGRDDAVIIPRPEPTAPNEPSTDPLAAQAGFVNSSPAVDLPRGPASQSAAGVAPISTIPLLPPIFPPSSDRTFDPLPEMIANPATPASSRLEPSAVESRQALPTRAVQPHVIEIRRPPPAVAPSPGPAAAPARPLRGRDPLLGPNPDVMPPLGSNSAARRDPAVSRAAFELAIPKTPAPKPKPKPKPAAPLIDPMTAPEELPPLTDPEASRTSAENVRGLASVPVSAPQPLVLDSATTPTPITTQPPVAAAEDTAVRSEVSTRTQFTIGKPAARVGDEVITLYELRVGYMKRLDSMGMRGKKIPEDSSRVLLMNVLNDLIDRSLILQEAKRDLKDPKKYKMFMDVADKVWMDEELPPLLRKHAASNIHELKEKLDERGDSIEETRNQYRLEFLSKGYMEQKLGPKMKVELPEMREYYLTHLKKFDQVAQITWREVVVEVGKAASRAAARDKADALLARLRHGEDFAALAKAASDGPNRADGGLWKTSPGGYAVPAVNLALESLPIGQISGVLESPTSFHVVLVEGRRRAGPATFAEVQDSVRRELRREKITRESTAYLDKLRGRSVVWTAFGDPNVQRASAEGPAAPVRPKP